MDKLLNFFKTSLANGNYDVMYRPNYNFITHSFNTYDCILVIDNMKYVCDGFNPHYLKIEPEIYIDLVLGVINKVSQGIKLLLNQGIAFRYANMRLMMSDKFLPYYEKFGSSLFDMHPELKRRVCINFNWDNKFTYLRLKECNIVKNDDFYLGFEDFDPRIHVLNDCKLLKIKRLGIHHDIADNIDKKEYQDLMKRTVDFCSENNIDLLIHGTFNETNKEILTSLGVYALQDNNHSAILNWEELCSALLFAKD